MLITTNYVEFGSMFEVLSSLRTMPAKVCIRPKKLKPYKGSLHLGQIRPSACPLCPPPPGPCSTQTGPIMQLYPVLGEEYIWYSSTSVLSQGG